MSVDHRLRRSIPTAAARLEANKPLDVESALTSVRVAAGRRQKMQMIAMTAAILAIALAALTAQDLGRLLSLEPELPPAERDRVERTDEDAELEDGDTERSDIYNEDGEGTTIVDLDDGRGVAASSTDVGRPSHAADTWAYTAGYPEDGPPAAPLYEPDPKPRTVERPYNSTGDPAVGATGCWASSVCPHEVEFQARKSERWISVEIRDSQGRPVRARIYIGGPDDSVEICRATDSPIKIPSGSEIKVSVYGWGCNDAIPNPSTGEIQVTFYETQPT